MGELGLGNVGLKGIAPSPVEPRVAHCVRVPRLVDPETVLVLDQ